MSEFASFQRLKISHCIYIHCLSIHLLTYLGSFHLWLLWITLWTWPLNRSQTLLSILLNIYMYVRFQGHTVTLLLRGTVTLFSKVATPFYTSTSSSKCSTFSTVFSTFVVFFLKNILCIYFAALGLSCGMLDLGSLVATCGIQFPYQDWTHAPFIGSAVLATGPPQKSQHLLLPDC